MQLIHNCLTGNSAVYSKVSWRNWSKLVARRRWQFMSWFKNFCAGVLSFYLHKKNLQQPTTTKIFSGICLGIWRHEGGEEERGISLTDSLCVPCVWFTMGSSEIMNKKEIISKSQCVQESIIIILDKDIEGCRNSNFLGISQVARAELGVLQKSTLTCCSLDHQAKEKWKAGLRF